MIVMCLAQADAELLLLALNAFDVEYAAPEERRRLAGITSALRRELVADD